MANPKHVHVVQPGNRNKWRADHPHIILDLREADLTGTKLRRSGGRWHTRPAEAIHLVMDNLNIHRQKSLVEVFGAAMAAEVWDRFRVHYTPSHGSWLNQAETEIGIFAWQCLGKRRIPNVESLRREAKAWNRRMNRDRVQIAWQFDRKTAR